MSVYIIHSYTCINIPCRENGAAAAEAARVSAGTSCKRSSTYPSCERPRRPFVSARRLASKRKEEKKKEKN